VAYAYRRWGATWWRLTTGLAGRYNAAATVAAEDDQTGPSKPHAGGDPAAAAEPTLSGIR